jgi:hypothetical protein
MSSWQSAHAEEVDPNTSEEWHWRQETRLCWPMRGKSVDAWLNLMGDARDDQDAGV